MKACLIFYLSCLSLPTLGGSKINYFWRYIMTKRVVTLMMVVMFLFASFNTVPFEVFASAAQSANADLTISNLAQLCAFRDDVNSGNTYEGKVVKLLNDIDMSSIENWTPIGEEMPGQYEHLFYGTFDGNNKTLYNLNILFVSDETSSFGIGFFGSLYDEYKITTTVIKNLNIVNCSIQATHISSNVGCLAGNAYNTSIINCNISGSISSSSPYGKDCGGIIGSGRNVTITNCSTTIESDSDIGGIIYYCDNSTFSNCHCNGTFSGEEGGGIIYLADRSDIINCSADINVSNASRFGGIICYSRDSTIINCSATGYISGKCVAGLIYNSTNCNIQNCNFSGEISGSDGFVGGLVGYSDTNTIYNCFASGTVFALGGDNGGLIGYCSGSKLNNCSFLGDINGEYHTGGLIGYCSQNYENTINNCFVKGSVYADNGNTGGLIGYSGESSITNCYSDADVISKGTQVGGLIGWAGGGTTVTNCYSLGSVSGVTFGVGGFIGYLSSDNPITNCYTICNISTNANYAKGKFIGYSSGKSYITNCYAVSYNNTSWPLIGSKEYTTVTNCYSNGTDNAVEMQNYVFAMQLNEPLPKAVEDTLSSNNIKIKNYGWLKGMNNNLPILNDNVQGYSIEKEAQYIQVIDKITLKPITYAIVNIDGSAYVTDSYGFVKYNGESGFKDVLTSANGYRSQKNSYLLKSGRMLIFLEPSKDDGKPYILSVKDVDTNKDLRYSSIYLKTTDETRLLLDIDPEWNGTTPGKYVIYQKNGASTKKIERSFCPFSFVPTGLFDIDSQIYVKLVTADGVESDPVKLNIHITEDIASKQKINDKIDNLDDSIVITESLSGAADGYYLSFFPDINLEYLNIDAEVEMEYDDSDGSTTLKIMYGIKDKTLFEHEHWINLKETLNSGNIKEIKRSLYGNQETFLLNNNGSTHVFSCIGGVEGEIEVVGCGEFKFDKNGNIVSVSGGIIVNAGIEGTAAKTFWCPVGPVVIPVYFDLCANLGAEGKVDLTYSLEEALELKGSLIFETEVTLGLGIGIANVIGAGLEGGANMTINILPYEDVSCDAELFAKLVAFVGPFEKKIELAKKTFHLWDSSNLVVLKSYYSAMGFNNDEYSNIAVAPQDYINKTTAWNGDNVLSSDPYVNITNLQEYILPSSTPQIFKVNDKLVMIFQSSDNIRSAINNSILMYSVFENGVWSQPQAVWDNGTGDYKATAEVINNKLYLVWEKEKYQIDNSDMGTMFNQYVNGLEIAYAEFDSENNIFIEQQYISNNNTYDSMPNIANNEDAISVVWLNNADFGNSGNVVCSDRINNVWSDANIILTADKYISEITAYYAENNLQVAYIGIDVENRNTSDVYVIQNNISTNITSDDNVKAGLSVFSGKLIWQSNGVICEYDGNNITQIQVGDNSVIPSSYKIVSNGDKTAIVWADNSNNTYTIYASLFTNNNWSAPIELISADLSEREGITVQAFDVEIINDGTWKIVLKTLESQIDEKYSIVYADVNINTDISNDKVTGYDRDRENGIQPIYIAVTNHGQTKIDKLTVTIYDEENVSYLDKEIDCELFPGEEITLTDNVDLSGINEQITLNVKVFAENDSNLLNNTNSITLGYTDLEVLVDRYEIDDKIIISAQFNNNTTIPTNVTGLLMKDALDGEIIETAFVSNIDSNNTYYHNYIIDKSTINFNGKPSKYYYIKLNTDDVDYYDDNNTCIVIVYNDVFLSGNDNQDIINDNINDENNYEQNNTETNVIQNDNKIGFKNEYIQLVINSTCELELIINDDSILKTKLIWKTSDATIATVSDKGIVLAKKEGTVTITASTEDGKYRTTCTINIVNKLPLSSNPSTGSFPRTNAYVLLIIATSLIVMQSPRIYKCHK